jgi:uncharacterized membrane protein
MKKDKGRLYFIPAWIGMYLALLNSVLNDFDFIIDTLFYKIYVYVAFLGLIICTICSVVLLVVHVKYKKRNNEEIEGDAK